MKQILIYIGTFALILFFSSSQSIDNWLLDNMSSSSCCSISCRNGRCSSENSPCNCTCINGNPSCSGVHPPSNTSSFHNRVWLENPEEQFSIYQREIDYATKMINDPKVSKNLKQLFVVIKEETIVMQKLFEKYEYNITAAEGIEMYNKSVARYAEAMDQ